MLIQDCVAYLTEQGFEEGSTEGSQDYNQYYFTRNGLLIGISEALSFNLQGRVNEIRLSAAMRGLHLELREYQKAHRLSGTCPFSPKGANEIIDWDMKANLYPMATLEDFGSAIQNSVRFVQRNQAVRMWSDIQRDIRAFTLP